MDIENYLSAEENTKMSFDLNKPVSLEEYNAALRGSVNVYYEYAINDPAMPKEEAIMSTAEMSEKYLDAVKKTSHYMLKSGLKIETYSYSKQKKIIDEIDKLLASHYGFTEEELDFIINYDIKYRMGDELNEE